jgi:hypothetical protein
MSLFFQFAKAAIFNEPVTLALKCALVSVVLAAWTQRKKLRDGWKPFHWCVLAHTLFFPAVMAVGMLFEASPSGPNRTGTLLLDVVVYGSLASCAFWVWLMKEFRWFASSLVMLMELPLLGALAIAGMIVTGDVL